MHDLPRTQFTIEEMLPAPGQGALGIEVRKDDAACEGVRALDHLPTRAAVTAERRLLASLHGGCLAPIAALARVTGDNMQLKATVLSQDGAQRLDENHGLPTTSQSLLETAEQLAELTSNALLERGAADLINAAR